MRGARTILDCVRVGRAFRIYKIKGENMSSIFERESTENVTSKDTKSEQVTSSKDKYGSLKNYAQFVGESVSYCYFKPKEGNNDPVLYINYKTEDERINIEEKIKMFYQEKGLQGLRMPLFKASEERSNFTVWIGKTSNSRVITLKRHLIEFIVTNPNEKDSDTGLIIYSYKDYKHQSKLNQRIDEIDEETEW